MATTFTETQRANIRLYLGYQDQFRDINTTLESQIGPLGGPTRLSDAGATLVISVLASLADIDAKLLSAHGRLKALKAEDIDLPGPGEIRMLRNEGRRFVGRLVSIFGVQPLMDVYGDVPAGGVIPLG